MALVGFQYEPVSLDVNEICFFKENRVALIQVKNQEKVKALLNDADMGYEV